MLRCLFALPLLLLYCLPLAAQETTVLRFSTQVPVDGVEFGLRRQFIISLCARLQRQCSLEAFPSLRAESLLREGKTDGEVGRAEIFELVVPRAHRVPTHIGEMRFVALALANNTKASQANSWQDLRELSVAYRRGYNFIARRTEITQLHAIDNYESCLGMVIAKRVDVCLISHARALELLAESGHAVSDFSLKEIIREPLYLYLAHHRANLLPQINQIIQRMYKDGTFDLIYPKGAPQKPAPPKSAISERN